jgi:hypothetical protein
LIVTLAAVLVRKTRKGVTDLVESGIVRRHGSAGVDPVPAVCAAAAIRVVVDHNEAHFGTDIHAGQRLRCHAVGRDRVDIQQTVGDAVPAVARPEGGVPVDAPLRVIGPRLLGDDVDRINVEERLVPTEGLRKRAPVEHVAEQARDVGGVDRVDLGLRITIAHEDDVDAV